VSGSEFNESGCTTLEGRSGILLGKAPVVAGEALLEGVLAPLRPRLVPVLVDNTEDDVCIDGNLVEMANQSVFFAYHMSIKKCLINRTRSSPQSQISNEKVQTSTATACTVHSFANIRYRI
jgi:hypothetical protein